MDVFTILLWLITIVFLGIFLAKDKVKTKQALKMAFGERVIIVTGCNKCF